MTSTYLDCSVDSFSSCRHFPWSTAFSSHFLECLRLGSFLWHVGADTELMKQQETSLTRFVTQHVLPTGSTTVWVFIYFIWNAPLFFQQAIVFTCCVKDFLHTVAFPSAKIRPAEKATSFCTGSKIWALVLGRKFKLTTHHYAVTWHFSLLEHLNLLVSVPLSRHLRFK